MPERSPTIPKHCSDGGKGRQGEYREEGLSVTHYALSLPSLPSLSFYIF